MTSNVRWSSKTSFIFAASAAAIGLGNVWRFSYLVGQNGGGAFVILYLLCVFVLALPLLIAEIVMGSIGRKNPVAIMRELSEASSQSKHWRGLGFLMLASGFLITTYYVVIVGWVLDYFVRSLQGHFHHVTLAISNQNFASLQKSPWAMLLTDSVVVLGALSIIVLGIKRGLERAVMIIFPALLVLMLLLLGYAMSTGDFWQGVHFMFYPDFSQLSHKVVLMALGQAFFSLNIAMGVTVMFSAYLPEKVSIVQGALGILVADTGFAILSGLIIFPIVFAYKLPVSAGPSLIFKTLPLAFGHMPMGSLVAVLFFMMLFLAAFSSVISLLEPTICWMIECCSMRRASAVMLLGSVCWVLSLGTIGSFSWPQFFSVHGVSFYQGLDFITAAVMLPLGGILIALFTGWGMKKQLLEQQLGWKASSMSVNLWRFSLRWLAPGIIFLILLTSVGAL